jgi:hypothetical protein
MMRLKFLPFPSVLIVEVLRCLIGLVRNAGITKDDR